MKRWKQFVSTLPLTVWCPAEKSVPLPPLGAHISYRPGPRCWQRTAPGWSNSGGSSVNRTTPAERRAPAGERERRRVRRFNLLPQKHFQVARSERREREQLTWYFARSLLFHSVCGTSWMESLRLWVLSLKLSVFGSSSNFPPICFSICSTSWKRRHTLNKTVASKNKFVTFVLL